MSKVINLSVHDIVDALLRSGSIDNRIFNSQTMEEGSKVHRNFQNAQDETYHPEYYLETIYSQGDIILDIDGRADGLITTPDGYIIDEIKSTVSDLKRFKEQNYPWHQGQAKMYAWMFCRERKINSIRVRLTYVRQHRESEHLVFEEPFTIAQLDEFADSLLKQYIQDIRIHNKHVIDRDSSLKYLEFPFKNWRPGQKDLFAFSERIASTGEIGYAEAPTGIGKTVCALMPALKAMGKENGPEKVYYLTSKNSIRLQALKTARILISQGAVFRVIALTAKERICLNTPELKKHCNPQECPFAVNFYDKLPNVLREAFSTKNLFDEKDIVGLAMKHTICPFELQMSMATFSDLVICDYNYIYDPAVNTNKDNEPLQYSLLVDEAHNLPSRARSMYSAVIERERIESIRKELPDKEFKKFNRILDDMISFFPLFENEMKENGMDLSQPIIEIEGFPGTLQRLCEDFVQCDQLPEPGKAKPVYFDLVGSLKADLRLLLKLPLSGAPNYCIYCRLRGGSIKEIEISCLDASKEISTTTSLYHSTLFFSATLSPMTYYIELLGGTTAKPENILRVPSPFDPSRKLVLLETNISTYFNDRDSTLNKLVRSLNAMVKDRKGNYFFFFPSFDYMEKVYDIFKQSPYRVLKQERQMGIAERDSFLGEFRSDPDTITIGFVVMGGIFGEGIELSAHCLQGVAIVTVGLPMVNFINRKLSDFYDGKKLKGFDYAFTFPGFNKVVQAAGRVIRDDMDAGVILLIDPRFSRAQYRKLINQTLGSANLVSDPKEIQDEVKLFWSKISFTDGKGRDLK